MAQCGSHQWGVFRSRDLTNATWLNVAYLLFHTDITHNVYRYLLWTNLEPRPCQQVVHRLRRSLSYNHNHAPPASSNRTSYCLSLQQGTCTIRSQALTTVVVTRSDCQCFLVVYAARYASGTKNRHLEGSLLWSRSKYEFSSFLCLLERYI